MDTLAPSQRGERMSRVKGSATDIRVRSLSRRNLDIPGKILHINKVY